MFLHMSVILSTGGHVWLLWGACMVTLGGHVRLLLGGMRGCSGGHAWLLGGHARLLWGGMCGCSGGHAWLLRGACVVAPGGVCGCSGGACMVALGGACVGYDEIRRYGQWAGGTHPTGMHSFQYVISPVYWPDILKGLRRIWENYCFEQEVV